MKRRIAYLSIFIFITAIGFASATDYFQSIKTPLISTVGGSITLGRDDAGTVTVTAADDNAVAALTVLPGGAAAMTLGGASTTAITLTTDGGSVVVDGTLNGVAPAGVTGAPETGTWTLTKTTSGTVTITSADDDANAALTLAAGGTGALTLGDAGSTTAITSSDWAIDATGVVTGLGNVTTNGDLIMTGGDITGANGNAIDVGEAADGTITFSRDDAGTVTLTTVDDDANAAMTVAPGGTGALTIGDSDSALALVNSTGSTSFAWFSGTLADDATDTLTPANGGFLTIYAYGTTSGSGSYHIGSDAACALMEAGINADDADTDAKLDVFDGGATATIRNRLGCSVEYHGLYIYNP